MCSVSHRRGTYRAGVRTCRAWPGTYRAGCARELVKRPRLCCRAHRQTAQRQGSAPVGMANCVGARRSSSSPSPRRPPFPWPQMSTLPCTSAPECHIPACTLGGSRLTHSVPVGCACGTGSVIPFPSAPLYGRRTGGQALHQWVRSGLIGNSTARRTVLSPHRTSTGPLSTISDTAAGPSRC